MFDHKKEAEHEIVPVIEELRLKCLKYGLPVFVTLAVSDDGERTKYISKSLSPTVCGKKLTTNLIARHALIVRGFIPTMPSEMQSIECDADEYEDDELYEPESYKDEETVEEES